MKKGRARDQCVGLYRAGAMTKDSIWSFGLMTGLAITMIAGGTSLPSYENFFFVSILNLALLAAAAWRLRSLALSQQALQCIGIIGCAIVLMSVQIIPLPYELWTSLAGRHFVSEIFEITPIQNTWMPLSLDPSATRANLVSLLPGIAAFAIALALPIKHHIHLASTVVAIAMLSVVIGLLQEPKSTGLFTNRNFYAAFLYSTIGFIFYTVHYFSHLKHWVSPIAIATSLLFVAAIGATGSRFSLLLAAILTAGGCLAISNLGKSKSSILLTAMLAFSSLVVLGGTGLARMTEMQTAAEFRSSVFFTSFEAASTFFPFGSGFGTFVPVYQLFETPSSLHPFYINHAHNDWLEIAIEGGLPALILSVAFLWWLANALATAWSEAAKNNMSRFASLTVIAMLFHSLFDYPLRTASLMCLFGLCCGVLAKSTRENTALNFTNPNFESARQ
jgi:O-antigen ligase